MRYKHVTLITKARLKQIVYQYKSAQHFRKTITFLTGISYSNMTETTAKVNRKYCLLF